MGAASAPLRCAGASLRYGGAKSNCCGVRGGKNRRRTLASRRENGILTLRGKTSVSTNDLSPQGGNSNEL